VATAWTKKLNKDQKISGYVAFDKEISKIEVRGNLFSNDVITIIFRLKNRNIYILRNQALNLFRA